MNMSRKTGLLIASGAAVVLAAIYFGTTALAHRNAHSAAAGDYRNVVTLDPAMFKGVVKEAYEIARENPKLLSQLHCYCGCERVEGHNNLLDCYRGMHASHCEICIGEAIDAERMYNAGSPVDQIRDALRARYKRHTS